LIRVCALDFDGVVLESVAVKLEAFRRLFSGHENSAEIIRYLETNNGLDRYTKFRHITTAMLGLPYDPAVEERMDKEFSALVLEAVLACPFVAGAEEFLRGAALPLYVISAMPLRELRIIVEKRGLAGRFKGLYGSPGRKADQLREVLASERLEPAELVFVGDSENDRKAAAEAGVAFIGRLNAEEFSTPLPVLLPDLVGLSAALSGAAR
jgi:HAD superfamily hydrolase (TIGR01549 family)